jgi:RHS repeat-associated protein
VIVQANGALCYDADFTPFGAERAYTSTCAQNYKFEGKERDTETGNDDFGAREYSWRFGRWLSSDWSAVPVAVPYANLTNPQTLNLYSMVHDDPESFADLDGHQNYAQSNSGNACYNTSSAECAASQKQEKAGQAAAQTAQQPKIKPGLVATSHVVLKNLKMKKDGTTLTTDNFGVGHIDANGKVTVATGDQKHKLTMTETYEPGHADPETKIDDKGAQRTVVGSDTYMDSMYANPGHDLVLDKRFTIDDVAVRVYDIDTGKGGDYIRQVNKNTTTTLSYEND